MKQAPPLSIVQVRILENHVHNNHNGQDVIAAGMFLFCLYSSSRFKDSQRPSAMLIDLDTEGFGFIELRTCKHKTATTKEKQTTLLPLVAVSSGLSDEPWGQRWIEERRSMGMDWDDEENFAPGVAMLPAPSSAGGWTGRPLTTGEATLWLRELLILGGDTKLSASKVSTHSLKATVLSWAAKANLPLEVRRILGHQRSIVQECFDLQPRRHGWTIGHGH